MKRAIRATCVTLLGGLFLFACGEEAASTSLQVERLPDVTPNLPEVPTLPPPPHPVTYPDSSYSVYGVRKRIRNTIDTELSVTGYIVDIYVPPECPEDEVCPRASAPHLYIADTRNEADRAKQLMLVGYAESQTQIDEAVEEFERGRYEPPPPESGILPIPVDFHVGNKVKITGRFSRVSGSGFNNSEGLVDYRAHDTIENVAAEEED